MKLNHDNSSEILHKYYDIIEGPQEHFHTVTKYIVSQQPELRDIAVRFIISLGLLLDLVLPS